MQSKHEISQLLESAGVRPNKRLGQNFLIDLNLMRLLIDTAEIQKDDVVLEVGGGTGSLTAGIVEKAGFCVSVEIDGILANIAKEQLADKSNVKIIAADALKNKYTINPIIIEALSRASQRHKGRLLLVANLPYSAATPLMLNLIAGPIFADAMYVTVQKEVAERMTAHPGTKDYGILSILLSATGDLKHIRTLKPTVFWPRPQINSAIVIYVRNPQKVRQIKSLETLSKVTGAFMKHRRKMLKSCCKLIKGELEKVVEWLEIFEKCGIDPTIRPDHLTPEQFVSLANLCR